MQQTDIQLFDDMINTTIEENASSSDTQPTETEAPQQTETEATQQTEAEALRPKAQP